VIGMRVVMADGSLVKAGARVVKNVAGYDLCKLFTGSYGTLGVIVEVNFKLRPLPFVTRTLFVSGQPEELLSSAQRIIQAPLFPVAVELVSQSLMSQLTDVPSQDNAFLMIRFAGSDSAVAAQIAHTREVVNVQSSSILLIEEDEAIWAALQALPIQFSERFMWRVGLRPTDAASFLLDLIKTSDATTMWHAGVGDGRIRVIHDSDAHDSDARIEHLRADAEARGGMIIFETGDQGLDPAVFSKDPTAGIMNKIKEQLDPAGILAPQRGIWK
jgi:FAD/FMN-containing dehydrogenase